MLKKCKFCGKEFNGKKNQLCCSRKCSNELKFPDILVKCETCGKEITRRKSEIERSKHHFCSEECRYKGMSTFNKGENNPNFKGKSFETTCDYCGKEIVANSYDKRRIKKYNYCSQKCKAEHQKVTLKGKNNPRYLSVECECAFCKKTLYRTPSYINSRINVYCSKDCKADWLSKYNTGKNNPNYDETKTDIERIKGRNFDGYAYWRREVYKRDNYTCRCCRDRRGGNLTAHHLNGYNWDKEHRTDIDNGITLCEECHNKFHIIYGYGWNTKQQFEEFMNNYINPVVTQ